MLIRRARVDPVTRGPVPVANGPSSARSCRPATAVRLATVKFRRAKKSATGVSASTFGVCGSPSGCRMSWGAQRLRPVKPGCVQTGGGAVDNGAEPVERLGGGSAPLLEHPALIMHIDTDPRAEHATHPPPLIEPCRSGEVRDDFLDVPLSAQGAVLPLLSIKGRQVLRERSPFGVRQHPEVAVLRTGHIVQCPCSVPVAS
jgi:hypothetical protein